MKKLALFFLIYCSFYSQSIAQIDNSSNPEYFKKYYIGINPIAIPAAFQLQEDVKRYIPVVTGLEFGFNVVGGYFLNSNHLLETRLALGNIHQIAFVGQLHAGTNYFFFKRKSYGFYGGGFLKFWDYYNRYTKIHFYNIAPYVSVGFWKEVKRFILIDVRLNQTIAVHSWSSLEHSSSGTDWFFSPWPKFLAVMPSLTVTLGWRF